MSIPNHSRRRFLMSTGGALAACGLAGHPAFADNYPSRPIRMIVPTGPGGGADTFGRHFAQKLSENMKTPVVVENIGGAGGVLGADRVAKSAGDGYTILYGINPVATMIPYLLPRLPYHPDDIQRKTSTACWRS